MTTNDHPGEYCRSDSRRARFGVAGAALLTAALVIGAVTVTSPDARAHGQGTAMWAHDGAGEESRRGHRRGHGKGGFMSARRLEHMLDHLDATPEQAEAVREIFDNAKGELKPLRKSLHAQRAAIAEAIFADDADSAEVERLRAEAIDTMAELSAVLVDGMQELSAVLEPEQRARVQKFMARKAR